MNKNESIGDPFRAFLASFIVGAFVCAILGLWLKWDQPWNEPIEIKGIKFLLIWVGIAFASSVIALFFLFRVPGVTEAMHTFIEEHQKKSTNTYCPDSTPEPDYYTDSSNGAPIDSMIISDSDPGDRASDGGDNYSDGDSSSSGDGDY